VPTLNAFDNGDVRATTIIFPIQDGREMEKKQNGLGLGSEGDPSYTLDRTGGQSVVIGIQNTVIGRSDTAGPQGKGHTEEGEPMFTVDTTSPHAVAVQAYDEYNDSVADTHHTLRAGTKQSTGVIENSIVRRLTPLECERLQGFPDGWTEGQPDTHRYKQMGNAVAVPVVEWIVQGICDTFDVAG
jgi:site-specific DNA-cytosine methylase